MGGRFKGVELSPGMMCRIQQRQSCTHTIITLFQTGRPFPPENYLLAKGWHKLGLLDEASGKIMDALADREREAKFYPDMLKETLDHEHPEQRGRENDEIRESTAPGHGGIQPGDGNERPVSLPA